MDTKIEIKKEDPLSNDIASQNEREAFTKNVIGKTNCDVDCDIAVKTEVKSVSPFPDLCLQKEREFISREYIMKVEKYNTDHEIEIKEESWWLETRTSFVCNDIKDGDFSPVKSPRLSSEAVPNNSNGDAAFPSSKASIKNLSFSYAKDHHECESQESDVTKIILSEKHICPEQSGKRSEAETYNSDLLIHKGDISPQCNIFHKSLTHSLPLKCNTLIHEDKKTHKCQFCEKSFTRLSNLKSHSFKHLGKQPYKCQICEKRFTVSSKLKRHNLTHEGKRPYKCLICEKSFIRGSHLKSHNLIHEGKKPHKCDICEKSFTRLSDLKSHCFIHGLKNPNRCGICEKQFTRSSDLKRHNLIHEGKKPHRCVVCKKSFTRLSSLKLHSLIHEGERPHKCEICEKTFTDLSNFKRHQFTHGGKAICLQNC